MKLVHEFHRSTYVFSITEETKLLKNIRKYEKMANEFFEKKNCQLNLIAMSGDKLITYTYHYKKTSEMLRPGQAEIHVNKFINKFLNAVNELDDDL